MCNGLACPADKSMLVEMVVGTGQTTGHDTNVMPPLVSFVFKFGYLHSVWRHKNGVVFLLI